ncbi:hypothetical protein NDU88_000394 [Pleurodeles waltl]|uniref:Uncharacterized protein n=1 Tax=Pleurodeles waltl TaxID=8319 RepID=A0AAV7V8X3_PLEWA|nr:hypothetical protein NDU88_000394 [Pleurodeles waltl]
MFESLTADIHNLKRDLSQELWQVNQGLTSVGNRVSSLEDNGMAQGQELEMLLQEVICLHEQDVLWAQVEDLENRSHRNNVRLQGVPVDSEGIDIQDYIQALFCHVLGWEEW